MDAIDPEIVGWCRAILDGDKVALSGLADRMEALDFPTYPVAALRKRKRLQQRDKFGVILSAYPSRLCSALCCQFARRVLPLWEAAHPRMVAPSDALKAREYWVAGSIADGDLAKLVQSVHLFSCRLDDLRSTPEEQRLRSAAMASVAAYGLQYSRPTAESVPSCLIVQTGGSVENVAGWAAGALPESDRGPELAWQFEQVISHLF